MMKKYATWPRLWGSRANWNSFLAKRDYYIIITDQSQEDRRHSALTKQTKDVFINKISFAFDREATGMHPDSKIVSRAFYR